MIDEDLFHAQSWKIVEWKVKWWWVAVSVSETIVNFTSASLAVVLILNSRVPSSHPLPVLAPRLRKPRPFSGILTNVVRRHSLFSPGNHPTPSSVSPNPSRSIIMQSDSPPPPSKQSLKAWWNHFNFAQKAKREAEARGMSSTVPVAVC